MPRGAVLVVVALSACEPAPMFSQAELRPLVDDLERRLAAEARATCAAPIVREPLADASSGADLRALFDGTSAGARCLAKLDDPCSAVITGELAQLASHSDGCSPHRPSTDLPDQAGVGMLKLTSFVIDR